MAKSEFIYGYYVVFFLQIFNIHLNIVLNLVIDIYHHDYGQNINLTNIHESRILINI